MDSMCAWKTYKRSMIITTQWLFTTLLLDVSTDKNNDNIYNKKIMNKDNTIIFNNHPLKGRRVAVNIYRAAIYLMCKH